MDLTTYRKKRLELQNEEPTFRRLCETCWQPDFSCYCRWVEPFDPGIDFVILIHPLEHKRRIATGRMSHLCLKGSRLIRGVDYSSDNVVNDLIADPSRRCVMLYPGPRSLNLSQLENPRAALPADKKLTIFVMDGTWGTVRKMIRLSTNLKVLPRICFTPSRPSNFRIRRQPKSFCYSTIEAIHHTVDLLTECRETRVHDCLLDLFEKMVNRQIELAHSIW